MAPRDPATNARARAPNEVAFEAIYSTHGGTITRYVRRRLGDKLAEDVTADVFSRALARTDTVVDRPVDDVLPWLFGIASHVIADHHRAEKRRLRALERLARTVSTETHDRPTDQLDAGLMHALRDLPATDREALLLVAWGELSYAEAAVALDVPVGTVRSRISRARRHLDTAAPRRPRTTRTTRRTEETHA